MKRTKFEICDQANPDKIIYKGQLGDLAWYSIGVDAYKAVVTDSNSKETQAEVSLVSASEPGQGDLFYLSVNGEEKDYTNQVRWVE